MKNIFKLKSLLFFVMVMVFFTTNVVLSDVNRKTTNKGYKRKNQSTRKKKGAGKKNKKRFSKKSIVPVSQIDEAKMTEAIEKAVMQVEPIVIFEEGKNYIDKFNASETKFDNAIKVGNYYLEIPDSMTFEEANTIVKDKLSLLLSVVMSAACNEQFNLGAIALLLDEDSDYNNTQTSNTNKIKAAIANTKFYSLSESSDIKAFIKSVIMLELKTLLYQKEEESYFGSWFRKKSVKAQIKEFVKNNHILNKIEALKDIRNESGLEAEVMYLVGAMGYYIKNNKDTFLDSALFKDIVHAITIPLNFKLAKIDEAGKINHSVHKEMRAIYKKILDLYDIKKISGIEESDSAQFIVQSTSAYVFTKVLQGVGILAAGALLGGGASAAKNLYYRDEQDKDKSTWDVVKEGGKKDLETVKSKVISGANYVSDKVGDGYDRTADLFETKVLRHEKGRRTLREEAKVKADEEAKVKADEEAKVKADEEAKVKADEEAKVKADEAAKVKLNEEVLIEEAKIKASEEAKIKANEEAKNATFLSEIKRYSTEQIEELSKKYDSLTPEEKERLKLALGLGAAVIPVGYGASKGYAAAKAAGGSKAVFNSLKTKGSDVVNSVKTKGSGVVSKIKSKLGFNNTAIAVGAAAAGGAGTALPGSEEAVKVGAKVLYEAIKNEEDLKKQQSESIRDLLIKTGENK